MQSAFHGAVQSVTRHIVATPIVDFFNLNEVDEENNDAELLPCE